MKKAWTTNDWIRAAGLVASLAGGVLVLVGIGAWFPRHGSARAPAAMGAGVWWYVALAIVLYVLAHAARAARLALLIGDDRVPLRRIGQAHFLAAGASLMIPFKLGEVYRAYEIVRLIKSPSRAILIIWVERALDLLTISALFFVALLAFPRLLGLFGGEILVTFGFIAATFVVFFVLPENIEGLKLYIMRRYNSARSLRLLRVLHGVQDAIRQAPGLFAQRKTSIGGLTLLIWGLEVSTIALFLPAAAGALRATLLALAFIFSSLLPSSRDGLAELSRQFESDLGGAADIAGGVAYYASIIFLPLLIAAAGVFAAVMPERVRVFRTSLQQAGGALPIPAGGSAA